MGRGSTDKNTIKLQNYLRMLAYTDRSRYALLDELLSNYGYHIYYNDSDVLMLRKPKDVTGLRPDEIHVIVTGGLLDEFTKGNDHES